MSLPIDVVFLTHDLNAGSAQRQTLELARRLNRTRFTTSLWTLCGPSELDAEAKAAGITVKNLGKYAYPSLFFPFSLLKALVGGGPDILVLCTTLPNIWGRLVSKFARVPIVVGGCRSAEAIDRQNESLLWRCCDHMICNSMSLYNRLCNLPMPSGRLSFISNGVDVEYFAPNPAPMRQREPLVLSVGRLVSDKDHMTLIRAFGRVLEEYPAAKLRIVGAGPQEFTLRRIIEGQPYRGSVHIVEEVDDLREFYHSARVFALASLREGQPTAILEAMASGLPVASTHVGGIPTLVEPNVTGLLAPPSDSVTMAANICQLLGDMSLCDRMGTAGRHKVVNEFAFTALVSHHEMLFERLWELHKERN